MTQYKMPGDHVISVNHNFGAITDYFPVCDNPNGTSAWGYRYNRHEPKIRYTWYDRYLWRRYEEMRKAEHNATGEEANRIWRYAIDFFDRYLRDRKYYYGSNNERE